MHKHHYHESVKDMSFDEFIQMHKNIPCYMEMTEEKRADVLKDAFIKLGGVIETKRVSRKRVEQTMEEKAAE
jgi:hypothetical protein